MLNLAASFTALAKVIGMIILTNFLLRFSSAIGVGFITYSSLSSLVDSALDLLAGHFAAIPVDIVQIFALAGGAEALSIVGSSLLTAASFAAAKAWLGVL